MRDSKLWGIGAIAFAIAFAIWMWSRPAHPAPAEWFVVEWPKGLAKAFRETPQKDYERCKELAVEKAATHHAACLSRAELEALKREKEKKK